MITQNKNVPTGRVELRFKDELDEESVKYLYVSDVNVIQEYMKDKGLEYEMPDVRGTGWMSGLAVAESVLLWVGVAGFPGLVAGCPGVAKAPDVRAGARCPAAEALGLLLVQILGGCTGAECPVTVASASPSSSVVASRLPSRMV